MTSTRAPASSSSCPLHHPPQHLSTSRSIHKAFTSYATLITMSNSNEPSKINANINWATGTVSETVGSVIGDKNLESSGAKQKAQGNSEYKAAQAQQYVEGGVDRVHGKVDNVVGAVTGDRAKQQAGQLRADKGEVQQELNK